MRKEILLYGPIGMAVGTTAEEVIAELSGTADVLVRINSAGGSFDEGPAIFNALRNHSGRVDTIIDGVGYSMAAVILQAGMKRSMAENAVLMVHGSQYGAQGSSEDLRKAADMMDVHTEAMRSAFTSRGIAAETVDGWLTDGDDHYFTAQEALSAGLIDEITGEVDLAAALKHIPTDIPLPQQIAAYRNTPKGANKMPDPKAPEIKPDGDQASTVDVSMFTANRDRNITEGVKRGQQAEMKRQNDIRAFFERPQFSDAGRIGDENVSAYHDLMIQCLGNTGIGLDGAREAALDMQDGIQSPIVMQAPQAQGSAYGTKPQMPEGFNPRQSPATSSVDQADKYVAGVTAAMEIKTGIVTDRTAKDAQGDNEFLGMSMVEMARRYIDMNRVPLVGVRREQIIGQALTMSAVSAHGTSDFANLLENVASKSMMMGWDEAPETWSNWARTGTLPDFKQGSRVNMSTFGDLDIVLENGEYKYGTFSDLKEVLQLATYGKLFGISRQALANDDLSALSGIPRGMGRAAARKIGDLAYGVLIANPLLNQDGVAVFAAGHNNLGTAGAPSVVTLDEARTAMALQKDPAGSTLNIRAQHLIVPIALQTSSQTLVAAQYDPAATAGTLTPNPFQGTLDVTADARLDDADPAMWYMAANGSTFDTVEVAFLNGQSTPYLEAQDGWRVDGQEYKVRIDAVAAPLDYRTMFRNAGA